MLKYRSKNGVLPSCIVVYRDGVGEGQITHVHKTEIKLMKVSPMKVYFCSTFQNIIVYFLQSACEQFYGPNSVPFAFIIVTKRISTRFFASGRQGYQNPQPGTVVDTVVTDPTM